MWSRVPDTVPAPALAVELGQDKAHLSASQPITNHNRRYVLNDRQSASYYKGVETGHGAEENGKHANLQTVFFPRFAEFSPFFPAPCKKGGTPRGGGLRNGHRNVTVVMTCRIRSPEYASLFQMFQVKFGITRTDIKGPDPQINFRENPVQS